MNRDPRGGSRRQQPNEYPTIVTASGAELICYPASVLAFIVDTYDRYLLLRRPGQPGWEVVSGPLEAEDTVQKAVTREVKEQTGPKFLTNYLCVLDTFTAQFDANLPPLISICCLLRHLGGEVIPSRNARDAEFRWWELSELDSIDLAVPRARWDLLTRSVDMSRYQRDAQERSEEGRGDLF